jgi:hypothetical protein
MTTLPTRAYPHFLLHCLRVISLSSCLAHLSASQSTIPVYKLAPDSPLATNGRLIYALADDQRTILLGLGTEWSKVWEFNSRVTGLTFGHNTLYCAVPDEAAIYAFEGSHPTLLDIGTPLQRPSALAFADSLVVADEESHTVFQLASATRASPVLLKLPPGPIHLAADATRIVATSPDTGEVRIWRPYENARLWTTNCKERCAPLPTDTNRVFIAPPPSIVRPAAVALSRGNTYLVDASSGRLYVARDLSRPAVVSLPSTLSRVSNVLVLGDSLLALDSQRGVLERLPLPIPLELTLGESSGQALFAFLRYLHQHQALPVRKIAWLGSVERTISRDALLEMLAADQRSFLVCLLNESICPGARPITGMLNVPDLEIDGQLEFETITPAELGDNTLREEMVRRVASPHLLSYISEDVLWQANGDLFTGINRQAEQVNPRAAASNSTKFGPYVSGRLGGLRARDLPPGAMLTIPIETRLCLVALPAELAHDDKMLSTMRLVSRGFSWTVLEDRVPSGSQQVTTPPATQTPPASSLSACTWASLQAAQAELLQTIHYELPALFQSTAVKIGVAENAIEFQHPDFAKYGDDPLISFASLPSQVRPGPFSPLLSADCQVKMVLEEQDHPTSVAGLIAARGGQSGLYGLAPTARLVPLRSDDAGLASDISAAVGQNVRIFNLSIHYGSAAAPEVRRRINSFPNALFVVAAGNDATVGGKAVCDEDVPYPAYPVCEGYRNNVLVVTATGLDGTSLIDPNGGEPGANWNPRFVHIAAPGAGFFALARGGVYGMVNGTSFAAPLVTATAALLYEEGVRDPWLIKQRIIATADEKNNLHDRLVGAGLLNVRRALAWPKNAVIVPDSAPEKIVDIEDDVIELRWLTSYSRRLPFRNVRRLTRNGSGFWRAIFLDDVTGEIVIKDELEAGPWLIHYRTAGAGGSPVEDHLENYADYVGPILD